MIIHNEHVHFHTFQRYGIMTEIIFCSILILLGSKQKVKASVKKGSTVILMGKLCDLNKK